MNRVPRPVRHYTLLCVVAAIVFFTNLGRPPLWDRDEPRNAGCAAEMLARGDWVVPVFNAELRTHKPILLYWLIMPCYALFGVNEFSARLPSALLSLGTVLITYEIGLRLFDARSGLWSGLILATTIMFGVAARAATPDATLIFCSTAAMGIFLLGAFPRRRIAGESINVQGEDADNATIGSFPKSVGVAVGLYGVMGLGVLAKGPVGLVLPTAVIGMFLLLIRLQPAGDETTSSWFHWLRHMVRPFAPMHFFRTCASMRPWLAILVCLTVSLPWYAWVAWRTDGVWTKEFFFEHNLSRATSTMEGHAGPPILFYVLAITVGFFPWTVFSIPTGISVYQGFGQATTAVRSRRGMLFMLCWAGVYITLFSFAKTKLPSYVTPCYPALALLVGHFVSRWQQSQPGPLQLINAGWGKFALGNLLLVGVATLVAIPIAARRFLPGSEWLGIVGIAPIVGAVVAWQAMQRQSHRVAASSLGVAATMFAMLLLAILPTEIGRHRHYTELFRQLSTNRGPTVAFGHLEPSWIFYSGRPIREFGSSDVEGLRRFLASHPDALMITTHEHMRELASRDGQLAAAAIVHTTRYFLRDRDLLLVAPGAEDRAAQVARRAKEYAEPVDRASAVR